ncbi:hypothetical protein SAY87_004056 [Trapa incisa]|uniref:PPC domain-containing protein n=1 Tax=Trapa incisa TaxID=236973 RepID=A0AAN7PLE0_9MYRT|nr:hypothetical protein SAY87_004056 [Trapa incisa]
MEAAVMAQYVTDRGFTNSQHQLFVPTPYLQIGPNPKSTPHPHLQQTAAQNQPQQSSGSRVKASPKRNSSNGGGADVSGSLRAPTRCKRGRPYGSRSRPKPPIVVTLGNGNAVQSHVLEVAARFDIVDCVMTYARRRGCGIYTQSGSGMVFNVTLRHPSFPPDSGLTVPGRRLEMISLTGTVLPWPAPPGSIGLSIFLPKCAGPYDGREGGGADPCRRPSGSDGSVFLQRRH